MAHYGTIFKLLFSYMFKRDKSKKSRGMWALYILLALTALIIGAGLVIMVAYMAMSFSQMQLVNELLTLLLMAGCVVVLIFGLVAMLNNLYFSRDTEFFLSLPVKPSVIYLAKLTVVYLTELAVAALILLPCMITAGVVLGLGPVFYITMIFGIALAPCLPLLIASVLAVPLMYVVSFFKQRGALAGIVLIVIFGLFFGGYYYLIYKVQSGLSGDFSPEELIAKYQSGMKTLTNALFPLAAVARFATMTPIGNLSVGVSMLANAGIFLGSVLALTVLSVLISSAVYRRGAASQLEGAKSKKKENARFVAAGAFKALVKKEWRELMRTTSFAFQCLSGTILCPILIVIMTLMNFTPVATGAGPEQAELMANLSWFTSLGIVTLMGVSMNIGASTSITREGQRFYYAKMMPVDYKTQIRAKSVLYLAISSATIVISLILMSILNFNFLNLILSIGYLCVYNYGYVHFAMFFDLSKPKLDWVTPNEAVKNNRNTMVPMFLNMGAGVILLMIPILLMTMVSGWVGTLITWCILYTVAIGAAVIFHKLLYANVDRFFARLS